MPNTDIAHERARSSERTCCIRCSKMIAHAKCCRRRYFSSLLFFSRLLHLCFFMLLLLLLLLLYLSLSLCMLLLPFLLLNAWAADIIQRRIEREIGMNTRKTSFIDYRWPLLQRNAHAARALTLSHCVRLELGLRHEYRTVQNAMQNRRSYELCVRMKMLLLFFLCARYARAHEPYA